MGTSGSLVKLSSAWANSPTNLCHLCVSCILCCWVILVHYTAKYLASYGVQWRLLLLPCNESTFFLILSFWPSCEGGLQFLLQLPVNIVIIWTFSPVLLWHSVASSSPAVLIDKCHCDIWHNVQVTSCLAATHILCPHWIPLLVYSHWQWLMVQHCVIYWHLCLCRWTVPSFFCIMH